ncbi:MAG TPA: DotA/TraY family protein, partial [Alphaproteobacteria bacterium]|nr:DotA/TraY family protein [Alphaproteobacteria bacterium]
VEQPGNLSVGNSQRGQLELAEAGFQQTKGDTDNSHWMDKIFSAIDWIASWDNVWKAAPSNLSTQNFTLGVQFTGGDPLDQIAALGHSNIKAAYDIFDAYIALQILAGTGKDLGGFFQALGHASPRLLSIFPALIGGGANITGTAAEALGGVFGTVSVVFFTAGFMLAYFLPLIPFFKFLFGILSWIVQVLEAVIAVPLIALAHLNPEGDGLPGANGKQSYYFIFNLFLWPVLMVFGLIVGLLLFYLAASALNMMFLTAVAGTGGLNHAHITLSRIAYSIIYVVVLYLCANNAFKMVDWLPQNCIRWMGAQGLHHLPMGDPTELQSYMGIAAGYVDSKIVGSSGGIARAAGPGALTNRTFWDKNVVAPITNMTERGGRAIGVKDPHGAATKVEGALDKVWAAGQKAGVPQFGGGESTDKPPEAKPSGGDASEGKGSGGSTTGGSQRDPGT